MSVYKFGGTNKLDDLQQQLDTLERKIQHKVDQLEKADDDVRYDIGYQRGDEIAMDNEVRGGFLEPMIAERKMELTSAFVYINDVSYKNHPEYWHDKELCIYGLKPRGGEDSFSKVYLIRGDMHSFIKIPLSLTLDVGSSYNARIAPIPGATSRKPANWVPIPDAPTKFHTYSLPFHMTSIKLYYRYL